MTKAEAYDAIAQAGPLLASLEKIIRTAMAVLDLPDELIPTEAVNPPKLRVVSINDAKQGDPNDWEWDKLNWDNKIYGDD